MHFATIFSQLQVNKYPIGGMCVSSKSSNLNIDPNNEVRVMDAPFS
jgi:hypothetical protein